MPSSVPFHYVDLRTFAYATEDEARVERALRTFLPEDYEVERSESEGHHGDRIVVLSTRVDHADDVSHVLDVVKGMETFDDFVAGIDDRIDDDCSLFVQFDKQAAYRGEVRLGRGILFRGKVEAYPAKRDAAVANVREALSVEDRSA